MGSTCVKKVHVNSLFGKNEKSQPVSCSPWSGRETGTNCTQSSHMHQSHVLPRESGGINHGSATPKMCSIDDKPTGDWGLQGWIAAISYSSKREKQAMLQLSLWAIVMSMDHKATQVRMQRVQVMTPQVAWRQNDWMGPEEPCVRCRSLSSFQLDLHSRDL